MPSNSSTDADRRAWLLGNDRRQARAHVRRRHMQSRLFRATAVELVHRSKRSPGKKCKVYMSAWCSRGGLLKGGWHRPPHGAPVTRCRSRALAAAVGGTASHHQAARVGRGDGGQLHALLLGAPFAARLANALATAAVGVAAGGRGSAGAAAVGGGGEVVCYRLKAGGATVAARAEGRRGRRSVRGAAGCGEPWPARAEAQLQIVPLTPQQLHCQVNLGALSCACSGDRRLTSRGCTWPCRPCMSPCRSRHCTCCT